MTDAPPLVKVHCNMVMKQRRGGIALGTCTHAGYFWDTRHAGALEHFPIITPEVDGGYWYVYGSEGSLDYPPHDWWNMDYLYQYAHEHQKQLISYPLRWWYPNAIIQPPDIEAWIHEAMMRYPLIVDWIVINEGWWMGNPTISAIAESCLFARKTRPDARLWYNGLLFEAYEQAQVLDLVARGLLDGIGIEMHHNLTTDISSYYLLLEQCKALAIPWRVSELDVCIPNTSAECLLDQAECYRQVLDLVWQYGGESVSMWGAADCVSWQRDYYPLPLDSYYRAKPAWKVLNER